VSAGSLLADPSLYHLEVSGDPELMQGVFQRHLQPLGEKAYQVRECQLSHISYRQALHCVSLKYTLRLAEPDTGCERIQEVNGAIYAGGRTRRIWEELRASEPGREIPDASPTFAPFSYIPDLEMLVQIFPYDRQLPTLPLLMVGPPPELEPLLLARFGSGDWQAEAWDTEVVRYLAERRVTLRLAVRARDAVTGRAEERRFYAKVYNNEETGEQTYQVLRSLWEKASAGGLSFTMGRPIAYLGGLRTLIQEEAPGTSLKDILLREEDATPVMRKAARVLASLHLDHVVTLRRRHLRNEVADLERKGKLLQWACPHLGPRVKEIVGAVVASLEEVPPAPAHCDLGLDHILCDGDRLALVDFDRFAEADPVQDAATFLAHLAACMPLHSSLSHDRAWTAARAFAGEYFAHVPESWRARLPLRYAVAVLRRATGFFQRQEPGWPDNIEVLVEEAENSLAGRVW
jgi:hypothetical protein